MHTKSEENQVELHVRMTQASGPSSLLLTIAPVLSLQEEFHQLLEMSKRFKHVTYILYFNLRRDRPTDCIRNLMQPFLHAMYLATNSIAESFHHARRFYENGPFVVINGRRTLDQPVTDEDIKNFYNLEAQRRMLKKARAVIEGCKTANLHLQVAISLLSSIGDGIVLYVDNHKRRQALAQQRARSWLPDIVHHAIHGKQHLPPSWLTGEDLDQVSDDFAVGSSLLQNLPALIDRWRIHFSQMSEICQDPKLLKELGYGEMDDLKRLYADRSFCAQYVNKMQGDGIQLCQAFINGDPEMQSLIAKEG